MTRRLRGWFTDLGDAIERIDVEGQEAWALREHVPEIAAARPSDTVRLLPGFDQWVLGQARTTVTSCHRNVAAS